VPRLFADITPLKVSPHFRRLWWGLSVSAIGTQFTITAVALEVYKLTQSTLAVGLVGAWALVPTVVMGLYGGALADRHDRRRVALVASAVMWAAVAGIASQAYVDLGNVTLLYILVAIQAGASAVNSPARSAIIPHVVPARLLTAANALRSLSMTTSVMIGPMLGALMIRAAGYGPTYTVDLVAFLFAIYAVWRLPPVPPSPDAGPSQGVWRSVAKGLGFVMTRPNLRASFLSDFCAMIFALPRAVFPAVGAAWIGGGVTTAGLLTMFMAVGATLASVLSGPLGKVQRQGRAVVLAVACWGGSVVGFGLVLLSVGSGQRDGVKIWALVLAGLALALSGASDTVSMIFRNTILLDAVPDHLRGRLQGVFIVVVTGGPRLGDMFSGANSSLLGEGWAVVVGGLICVVGVLALAVWQRSFWHYDSTNPVP